MNDITFSVILPNFNHGHYLNDAINAMLKQTAQPDEIIVIDDGSTDNSADIVSELAKKHSIIQLLKNDKNMGVMFSLEKGLKHAKSDYVCLPSADDKLLPGFFEKSVELLKKYPQAGFCCSDSKTIIEDSGEIILNKRRLSEKAIYISSDELVKIMRKKIVYFSGFGTIFKKNFLDETGVLSELKWSSDRMYTTIIALRYGFCCIPETLAVHRSFKESYSEKGMNDWKKHKEIIKKALELLKEPIYSDVLSKFKKSCALASLEAPMLRFLITNKKHRDYLSFNLVKLILWQEFKKAVRGYSPAIINKFITRLRDGFLK